MYCRYKKTDAYIHIYIPTNKGGNYEFNRDLGEKYIRIKIKTENNIWEPLKISTEFVLHVQKNSFIKNTKLTKLNIPEEYNIEFAKVLLGRAAEDTDIEKLMHILENHLSRDIIDI